MRYTLFQRRAKQPPLIEGEKQRSTQRIERLKAGRLASLSLSFAATLIEQFGPRLAGSESSHNAAAEIERSFTPFCDSTERSTVPIDRAFHSLPLKTMVYLYPLLGLLVTLRLPLLALLCAALYLACVWQTIYRYKSVIRLKRHQVEGVNVHAAMHPAGPVERTIIFTAHHDSAPLNRYNRLNRASYAKRVLLPLLLFAVVLLLALLSLLLLRPFALSILSALMVGATPFFIPLLHFWEDRGSPGAGDNLTSVGMLIQLARYFHWRRAGGSPLKSTRLIFCSFDGEESGLEGSRAWYEQHHGDVAGAIVVNFDGVYYSDALTFLERDANGTQPLSERLSRRCVQIARSMGYEATSESIPRFVGATDATWASRYGLEATTLTAIGWDDRTKASVYHTEGDVVDAIDPKAVEMALSIAIKLVELADEGLLWEDEVKAEPHREQGEPSLFFSKLTHR